jgi:serine phosphatase RsbU (regulator of sigma subunit)
MVSVVCSNALNRSVKEFNLTDTGKILDKTRQLVIETFEKSNSDVKDGMDISLLCIDKSENKLFWSGANNPLWIIKQNKLIEIKPNKQPIGKSENPKPFITHEFEYSSDTTFYLFTDGFADQFGGPKGKKFMYKQFENLLLSIAEKPMHEQKSILNDAFINWKNNLEQVDDVCVIGIKI